MLLDCKYYISREPWGSQRADGECCKNASGEGIDRGGGRGKAGVADVPNVLEMEEG